MAINLEELVNNIPPELTPEQKAKILEDAKKLVQDAWNKAQTTFETNVQKELTTFVDITQNLITAVDFTNPANAGAINAKDKEPIWIYLKKQYEKAQANGGELPTQPPPDPPFDFCVASMAQVMAAKGIQFGNQAFASFQALQTEDFINAIDGQFPGFKDAYGDLDKWRKAEMQKGIDKIAKFRLERESLFSEVTKWNQWDATLGQEINKFKQTSKDSVSSWIQEQTGLDKEVSTGLASAGLEVLENCYQTNPAFAGFRKVMEDTQDTIKAYTDALYTQISNLNDQIAKVEGDIEDVFVDVRDYDPFTLVSDTIDKVNSCWDCFAAYTAWKTDTTGTVQQPICGVDWCVPTGDFAASDWLNTPKL